MNDDPFLKLGRDLREQASRAQGHTERAHSKLSASGAERWFNCPGSVALSEGLPDKPNRWSIEGTKAHEVLEEVMLRFLKFQTTARETLSGDREMQRHAIAAAKFILDLAGEAQDSEVLIETRVSLDFIHPEMFGTFDGAVVDHFDTLHVFDYKYGVSPVSPHQNLQMCFYGIGLARRYHWNFKRVKLWIIQPRVPGYLGPVSWNLSIPLLKEYVPRFREAAERVEREPETYVEGSHCYWCKAKAICPLKQEGRNEKAKSIFSRNPIDRGFLED